MRKILFIFAIIFLVFPLGAVAQKYLDIDGKMKIALVKNP